MNRKSVAKRTIHIVGGGAMGLAASIATSRFARQFDLPFEVTVYEAEVFGGGLHRCTSAPRSQSWGHDEGVIWAMTQPQVSIDLQQSMAELRRIAPSAFSSPLAFAFAPDGFEPTLSDAFRVLGIWNEQVPLDVMHSWFKDLKVPKDTKVYRTRDRVIHLPVLSLSLKRYAERCGVKLVNRRVHLPIVKCDQIDQLVLADGDKVQVSPGDQVLFACGPHLNSLLAKCGISIPGIRLFRSRLVASRSIQMPAILAYVGGGVNCVPHLSEDGRPICVFGDSEREEVLSDDEDQDVSPESIERLVARLTADFGFRLDKSELSSWLGIKAELVSSEVDRSQAHHATRVPGVSNAWFALPGKLSQCYQCAVDLARLVLASVTREPIANSIWNGVKQPIETRGKNDW